MALRRKDPGIAVLVDGDNVPPSALGAVLDRLDGPITERRVWRNWRSQTDSQEWDGVSKELAFERVDRYKTRATGKNASDIAVAIGALDLYHAGYRRFCIVSGDTDFAPLIERLRRGGAHVIVVGHHGDPGLLEELADEYWTVPALLGKPDPRAGREAGKRAGRKSATPAEVSSKAAPKAARGRGRKSSKQAAKASEVATKQAPKRAPKQAQPGRAPAGGAPSGKDAQRREARRDFLADVYDTAVEEGRADDDGWITVDGLGRVARAKGGFDTTRYGLPARTGLNEAFRGEKDLFEVHAQTAKGGTRQIYRVRRR